MGILKTLHYQSIGMASTSERLKNEARKLLRLEY
jgi:hypothetical protein